MALEEWFEHVGEIMATPYRVAVLSLARVVMIRRGDF